MKKIMCAVFLITIASACTEVVRTPVAIEGSRADASIVMAYDVSMFEQVKPDWEAAGIAATERCKIWGYSSASAFAGTQQQCNAYNGYGNCMQATISKTYQCAGRG